MKSSLVIFALCISLAACNKQQDTAMQTPMRALHQRISAEANPYLQKAYYTTLTGAEKAALWRVHVSETAAKLVLTGLQKSIIEESYQLLTAANFEYDAMRKSDKYIIWQQKMLEAFSRPVAYSLFASMNGASADAGPDNPVNPDCGCSTESNWCNFGTGGTRFDCEKTGCKVIVKDCGTWWNYDCNGACTMIKPINPW